MDSGNLVLKKQASVNGIRLNLPMRCSGIKLSSAILYIIEIVGGGMMKNIYIVDRDVEFAGQLKEVILSYLSNTQRDKGGNYESVTIINQDFDLWLNTHLDRNINIQTENLYILDTNLKDEVSGLEIASRIRCIDAACYIMFISSQLELMNQVLQYNIKVMSYILKSDPLLSYRLESTLDQIAHEGQLLKQAITI